ncbi:MAG: gamma-glutamyltranspeptidase/glutathione hydrolase [Halieaceae bacterium]|jgi:gamma-glutamyltranspeptidase/glutathione hydrolase
MRLGMSMKLKTLVFLSLLYLSRGGYATDAALAMPDQFSADTVEEILLSGGNAIDAAIAAAFSLAATFPEAGNIGAGGFMMSYMKGEAAFLDFRERAPGAANRDMYLNESGQVVESSTIIGGRASGVPGTVRGMQAAHKRYGSLPWKRLLQPAITLAEKGFIVHPTLAELIDEAVKSFGEQTNFKHYFGDTSAGQRFVQPELAQTLRRIAIDPEDFYQGTIAHQIVAQMERSGGIITLQDLSAYKAIWREPLRAPWREYEVLGAPPPSSGGFALIQLLLMRDFAQPLFADRSHNSARYIHLLAELEKRVFADRAEYLGDPDFVTVPLGKLLAPAYLQARIGAINPKAISKSESVKPGIESHQTTHFSILDKQGNAVALTYTLNWEFGSGVVVEDAGFLLNNQMDDFSALSGMPNKFGVIGGDFNAIAPGKRMLSSMSPTILLRDNQASLIIGTPGGSTIFTSVFQVILNLYDFDMPLQAAVAATRFHHQLPAATLLRHDQRQIPLQTKVELETMGYVVRPNSWGNLGDIQAIQHQSGKTFAVADPRGRGVAKLLLPSP